MRSIAPAARRFGATLALAAGAATAFAPTVAADTTPPAQTPSSGVTEGLSVSLDGKTYSRHVADSLFSSLGRIVPGDTAKDSVWLRNDADLTIAVQLQLGDAWTTSDLLADATTLRVGDPADALETDLGKALVPGRCTVVSNLYTLEPGESVRVNATISLSPKLKNREGTLSSLGFRVSASAVDADVLGSMPDGCWSPSPYNPTPTPEPSTPPSTPPTAPPPSPLPSTPPTQPTQPPLSNTGANALAPVLVGTSLVALGLLAVVRRRRRNT